jgi:RNA polymerase sigma-70 factor, ECF subfamily
VNKRTQEPQFATQEFINLLQTKDRQSIELLVDAYTEHLLKGALGLGFSENDAKDLVQNVWMTFVSSVEKFQGNSHPRTYLFGILFNKAREARRENSKDIFNDPIDDVVEEKFDQTTGRWVNPASNPEKFFLAAEQMEIIKNCIDKLPVNQRMAFCLQEIDDHPTVNICEILKVTTSNLGVLLFRAKNRLKECIERKSQEGL